MRAGLTWPPPPDTPDPMAAHDQVLAALIRAPAPRRPMSRPRLVRALCQATGLGVRQCVSVVSGHCGGHGVLPPRRGLGKWLPFLPSLVLSALSAALIVSHIALGRGLDAAPIGFTRWFIGKARSEMGGTFLLLLIADLPVVLVTALGTTERGRRGADDAREKVAG